MSFSWQIFKELRDYKNRHPVKFGPLADPATAGFNRVKKNTRFAHYFSSYYHKHIKIQKIL